MVAALIEPWLAVISTGSLQGHRLLCSQTRGAPSIEKMTAGHNAKLWCGFRAEWKQQLQNEVGGVTRLEEPPAQGVSRLARSCTRSARWRPSPQPMRGQSTWRAWAKRRRPSSHIRNRGMKRALSSLIAVGLLDLLQSLQLV